MQIYFDGYNDDILIFEANETIPSNSPVMVTSNGTVSTAHGQFCGICKDVKNGYAAVQLQGYVVDRVELIGNVHDNPELLQD